MADDEAAQVAQLLSDTNLESSVDLNELLSESLDFDDDDDDEFAESRDDLLSPASDSLSDLSGLLTPGPSSGRKPRGGGGRACRLGPLAAATAELLPRSQGKRWGLCVMWPEGRRLAAPTVGSVGEQLAQNTQH